MMDYLTELYLFGQTTLILPGTNERYVLNMGNAVPAFEEPKEK